MKLLMAVSQDGFVARGPDDDMAWTGPTDKAVFKLLTMSSPDPLLVGRKTYEMMPRLPGRDVRQLSNTDRSHIKKLTLKTANLMFPNAWLIGGQTVAVEAMKQGFIHEAYWSIVAVNLGDGVRVDPKLREYLNRVGFIGFSQNSYPVTVEVRR